MTTASRLPPGTAWRLGLPALLVVAAAAFWWLSRPGQPPAQPRDVASGTAPSPYLNVDGAVGYVGVAACAECHPTQYETYRATPHSRAFRRVEPANEPLPGVVDHERSGLRYEMYERDGEMRIRESVRLPAGANPTLTDLAVQHVVGSGESSLTYVAERDGFLLQSPTTWFTRPGHWAMSPGYDMRDHLGFARGIGRQCLACHVGRIEKLGESDHRIAFREDAIGCERCHGPGEAHAAFHRAGSQVAGTFDPTIVVPSDLPRVLTEDVCSDCHLDDTMVVERPGVDAAAWRPGLEMNRYRVHYGPRDPSRLMKVVGHMDQMRASRCYQESGRMTCLTCHDPHGRPAPEARAAFYRARCLTCHQEESCAMDGPHRRAEHPDDSCIACHMPTVGTDIVHFAFTHHRVAIHRPDESRKEPPADFVDLVPTGDVSHVGALEQRRNLGMAYMQFAHRPTGDPRNPRLPWYAFRGAIDRAHDLLHGAYEDGQRDPHLLVTLAHLASIQTKDEPPPGAESPPRWVDVLRYAQEALASTEPMPTATLVRGLALQGTSLLQALRPAEARAVFERLTTLRRDAVDWNAIHDSWLLEGDRAAALAALDKALEILPTDPSAHERRARLLHALGRTEEAALHHQIAEHLVQARTR